MRSTWIFFVDLVHNIIVLQEISVATFSPRWLHYCLLIRIIFAFNLFLDLWLLAFFFFGCLWLLHPVLVDSVSRFGAIRESKVSLPLSFFKLIFSELFGFLCLCLERLLIFFGKSIPAVCDHLHEIGLSVFLAKLGSEEPTFLIKVMLIG